MALWWFIIQVACYLITLESEARDKTSSRLKMLKGDDLGFQSPLAANLTIKDGELCRIDEKGDSELPNLLRVGDIRVTLWPIGCMSPATCKTNLTKVIYPQAARGSSVCSSSFSSQ